MKVDSHSKSILRQTRAGWTRTTLVTALLAVAALFGISGYVFLKLIGRRPEDPIARIKRMDEAHACMYDQQGGERVTFPTTDNQQLTGTVIERPNACGTIVMCHGFWRDKEAMVRFIPLFPDHHLFLFDFRACGESSGDYTSIGCHEHHDVMSAVKFVRQHPVLGAARPLLIFGVSMGAAAAIKAASEVPDLADALILDSPYACLTDEISHVFGQKSGLPYYPFFPIMLRMFQWFWGFESWAMKPELFIRNIKLPLLLIHSSTDAFTLPHHSVRLYAEAGSHNKKARLWIGPPARHTALYKEYPEYYQYKVHKFLCKLERWLS